jgi:hypothetical protein
MSTGVSSENYQAAYVETVRIFNVNNEDWTVDCVSEHGNKRFFDIQVSSPYFHFDNGEGQYTMPEVGALAWVCIPSNGTMAQGFLMGFKAPFDEDNNSFRSGRPTLNPGDQMFRTRDENFVILRRGGVVQIGSTPIAQRIYVPIRNFIQDFCENYKLTSFGGEMFWETQRDDQSTDGDAPTKFYLKSKQRATDPQHIAELTMGSHGDGDPLTMELSIWTDGSDSREAVVRLQLTNEGDVVWDIEKDWTQNVTGRYAVSVEGDVSVSSQSGMSLSAQQDVSLESVLGSLELGGKIRANLTAGAVATIDAPVIRHGAAAGSPAVKGLELTILLTALSGALKTAAEGPAPWLKPAYMAIDSALATIVSVKNFVE